jgi:hypothetical protein
MPHADNQPGRYCRGCDYDLRASESRCPECGRPFDAANPRTYRRRPRSTAWRWVRRGLAVVLLPAAVWLALAGWLWLGWRAEERALTASPAITATSRPSTYPRLALGLPDRLKYVADRVTVCDFNSSATDADLARLAALTLIQNLSLRRCPQITDAGLAHLAGLKQLQSLDLRLCPQITDAGLAHLAGMTQLQGLGLANCLRITDAGLAHLAGLTQVQSLDLSGCTQITDAGLAHLAGMARMRTLTLRNCPEITDAGLDHLVGLKQMQLLFVRDCPRITLEGMVRLRAAIPGVAVGR